MKKGIFLSTLIVSWLQVGCVTFDLAADRERRLIRENKTDQVVKELNEKAWREGDDQLVYLFDYGIATHINHQYQESNKALLLADQLSEVKDYQSLSRITGSLLLNEGMVQYKGDDYEKVLVNAFLAMNYLMLHQHDEALVETRKINQKLDHYRFEAKKDYEQNPFAHYLAAMIWESDERWDDAYIDYKKSYDLIPSFSYLSEDLIRLSLRSQRKEDLKSWQKKFPAIKSKKEWTEKDVGEVIFIYQQGWGPRKYPDPGFPRLPRLYPVSSLTQRAKMNIEGVGDVITSPIFSIEDIAMKTLGDQYATLITKRLAGIAAKATVAQQIRKKNEALGDLAWIGMNLMDRADTRQWSNLPQTIQIARYWLKSGSYKVHIVGLNSLLEPSGENSDSFDITIAPHKKEFFTWRSVR